MDHTLSKKPLFSILIANFNNARYLQEAIDSVLSQSYTNWEVVLVDDASTDGSAKIYEQYSKDGRFRLFFNDINRGCGYTKKRCIELAKGELCGFLDSDDALMPNALEVMVQTHACHPECSLIYSTCYRYSGDKSDDMPIWDFIGAIPSSSDFLIYQKKLVSHFVSFKKSYYSLTVGMDESLRCAEDRDLYYKLEEVGNLLHLPIPLYYYRVNNENSVSIGSKEKDIQANYYSVCAELNAICRRIGGNLYRKNKEQYRTYLRKLMGVYYRIPFFNRKVFARYAFHYVLSYHFSPRAFSHLYKITKGR